MRIDTDFVSAPVETSTAPQGENLYTVEAKNRQAPGTVLVIDDDPGLQRLIGQTIGSGARVLQEYSGNSEYIKSLEFEGVDAVILDYQIPGPDGLEILEKIRGKYPRLPILFMTGFGDLDVAREAVARGG